MERFRWVNLVKSSKNILQNRRMPQFIGEFGRNRPIDAFNPHQRSGLNASKQTVMNISWPLDRGWTLRMNPRDMRYKMHQTVPVGSRSDDRDAFSRVKSWPL